MMSYAMIKVSLIFFHDKAVQFFTDAKPESVDFAENNYLNLVTILTEILLMICHLKP
jgi:hypothetical protein